MIDAGTAALHLVDVLKDGRQVTDDDLVVLVEAQADTTDQKRLVIRLRQLGLIDDDQTAFAFYRWQLREA